jgi:hypothetical protein
VKSDHSEAKEKQIPPLRCGMTNKETYNGNNGSKNNGNGNGDNSSSNSYGNG